MNWLRQYFGVEYFEVMLWLKKEHRECIGDCSYSEFRLRLMDTLKTLEPAQVSAKQRNALLQIVDELRAVEVCRSAGNRGFLFDRGLWDARIGI